MSLLRPLSFVALLALTSGAFGCALLPDDSDSSSSELGRCAENVDFRFPNGSSQGHADPLGAAAAGQARAGKIESTKDIAQPADARHKIRKGDFVLANDKIAVYIEAEGPSDGYFPWGGEILGIEPINANGRPAGVSYYGEAAIMFGLQTLAAERVSVLADGSDGGPAIVRAAGTLKMIPVLDAFVAIFPDQYNFPIALDYVLEPGATKVNIRVNVANTRSEAVDMTDKQALGFFQSSRSMTFSEGRGFDRPLGDLPWIAWDNGPSSFLFKGTQGPISVMLDIAGLQVFKGTPISLEACERKSLSYLDVVSGGPGIDGVLEAKRKTYGEAAWREVKGVVRESGGGPLAGAVVHATSPKGYLTRATTDERGRYTLHVPQAGAVDITPTLRGWAVPPARPLTSDETGNMDLTLPKRATIEVNAYDKATGQPLPARVQIVPDKTNAAPPDSFGVHYEPDDRLYREYPMDGHVVLPVPPGGHRVIVTRGYEYEVFDAPVVAAEGETTRVRAELTHSVDSTGTMCADFHIHSIYSADSSDPVERKVRAAIADGLEIPVSSEHEYVIDFQPTVQRLGMTAWAFGMGAEELTTFSWGHFGVFPLRSQPDKPNNGAFDWSWKNPPQVFPEIGARPEQPVLIANHPRDSAMGYFALAGFDRKTMTGTKGLWSDDFGAIEVFNDSDFDANRDESVADWFAFLNAGKRKTAVGSSDSHELSRSPVGYPRTCMAFGHDDPRQLTPEAVRDRVKTGSAIVSGGISMTVKGPDGVLPGGTSSAGVYEVVVATPGWFAASELEVIVDGVTTETIQLDPEAAGPGPGKRHVVHPNVAASSSKGRHWVVFHARGNSDLSPLHPGRRPFAASNPIFF